MLKLAAVMENLSQITSEKFTKEY